MTHRRRPSRAGSLNLRGRQASEWLLAGGFGRLEDSTNALLIGDHMSTSLVSLSRFWMRRFQLIRDGTGIPALNLDPADLIELLVVVEGRLSCELGEAVTTVGQNQAMISSSPIKKLASDSNVAYYEIALSRRMLAVQGVSVGPAHAVNEAPVFPLDEVHLTRQILFLVNSILNGSSALVKDVSWAYVEAAIAALFCGVLQHFEQAGQEGEDARSRLFHEAMQLIRRRARMTDFCVQSLANELEVSTRYLQAAFNRFGKSPREEILRARLAVAQALLAVHEGKAPPRLSEVALRAGFSSAPSLRRALAQHSEAVEAR